MDTGLILVLITVFVALTFDFINGFHDAANSIATVVSTRVLSPKIAVIWAAFFNFVAAFLLGTAVAKTIGKGMIQLDIVTQYVVLAGLARRDRLGSAHLVVGTAHLVLPRTDRRLCRRRHGSRHHHSRLATRLRRHHPRRLDQDAHLHRRRACHGIGARLHLHGRGLLDLPQQARPSRSTPGSANCNCFPPPPTSLGHGGNDAQKTMGIIAGALYTGGIS